MSCSQLSRVIQIGQSYYTLFLNFLTSSGCFHRKLTSTVNDIAFYLDSLLVPSRHVSQDTNDMRSITGRTFQSITFLVSIHETAAIAEKIPLKRGIIKNDRIVRETR